jgi:hypothetical protein
MESPGRLGLDFSLFGVIFSCSLYSERCLLACLLSSFDVVIFVGVDAVALGRSCETCLPQIYGGLSAFKQR